MIETSKVNRSLDRKSLILWLELTDIFVLVSICSILNILFGGTDLKLYLVYLPTLILAITLVIAKRGRPDGFLFHFLKFCFQPKHLTCFELDAKNFSLAATLLKRRKELK